VKFNKKKATNEAIQQDVEHPIRIDNKIPNENAGLDRKLRLFIDIFNALAGDDKNDVRKNILVDELVNTGRLTEQDVRTLIRLKIVASYLKERMVSTPWPKLDIIQIHHMTTKGCTAVRR
jgi:hypothetical protein